MSNSFGLQAGISGDLNVLVWGELSEDQTSNYSEVAAEQNNHLYSETSENQESGFNEITDTANAKLYQNIRCSNFRLGRCGLMLII